MAAFDHCRHVSIPKLPRRVAQSSQIDLCLLSQAEAERAIYSERDRLLLSQPC